jgi:hypothetical protein
LTGVEQDGQNGQREPWMTGWLGHVTSDDGLQGDRGALPQQLSRLAAQQRHAPLRTADC